MSYSWPGNVRELSNVIERGIILAENDLITVQSLPADIANNFDGSGTTMPFPTLAQQEEKLIMRVLTYVNNNKTEAAKILGIGRKTLYRKLKDMGIKSYSSKA